MINTFHTSYNPPPVPPRSGYNRLQPPPTGNTPLVKFLSVMLLLLMLQTFGGFLYLSQKITHLAAPVSEKAAAMIGQAPPFNGPAAHMALHPRQADSNKQLVWNKDHSLLRDIGINSAGDTLIIKNPGMYFIYSQITFSKHSSSSLKQGIWSKKNKDEKPEEILKSFCSLDPNTSDLCTASLSGVFHLKENQELYVTVTNISLLNKDSCSFGLFKI